MLTNSAKYTKRKEHIPFGAHQEGDFAVISVRDNGIGIAPEMWSQIFELFVQADLSSTKSQGGLGVGHEVRLADSGATALETVAA